MPIKFHEPTIHFLRNFFLSFASEKLSEGSLPASVITISRFLHFSNPYCQMVVMCYDIPERYLAALRWVSVERPVPSADVLASPHSRLPTQHIIFIISAFAGGVNRHLPKA